MEAHGRGVNHSAEIMHLLGMHNQRSHGANWAGAALLLTAVLIVLAGTVLFVFSQQAPRFGPSPSPTAASPVGPSPSCSTCPAPTTSPQPTASVEPNPTEPTTSPTSSPTPSAMPSASPEPSASSTPSPTASPTAAPQAGWLEIANFPTYRGSTEVQSITAGGPGFVAVGTGGRELRGRVWTSADGRSWTAQPDGQFRGFYLRKVVRAGEQLYLFGSGHDGTQIWRSTNARTWDVLPSSPELTWAGINDVAVVGQTILAAGFVDDPEGDFSGAVWRSTDGVAWQRVAAPGGDREVWAVAVRGTTLVAVDRFAAFHGSAPIHYSMDLGDSWQAAQTDFPTDEDNATGLVSIAADNRRFVAVGYAETFDYRPIATRSGNGMSWNSTRPAGVNLLGQVVALRGGGFLALEGRGMRALISDNGRAWNEVAPLGTDRPAPPPPSEGGDEVVTTRVLAANRTGVVVIQRWGNGVVVWFGHADLFR